MEEWARLTRPMVTRFLAQRLSAAELDDVVQDTYVRAMAALPSFRGDSAATTWLLAVAQHTVLDTRRRGAARPACVPWPEAGVEDAGRTTDSAAEAAAGVVDRAVFFGLGTGGDVADEVISREGVGAVMAVLRTLSWERREAWILTQLVGVSYEHAAELTGVPVGTVRSRVSRARRHLAETLSAEDSATEGGCSASASTMPGSPRRAA